MLAFASRARARGAPRGLGAGREEPLSSSQKVGSGVPEGALPAGDAGRQRPLEVVILGDWLRFPHGMAATSRARLVARALAEAGVRVRVVVLQAGDRASHVENTAVRGVFDGIPFEYTCGTTVRHDSFAARRLIAAWGWVHGALRLMRLRAEGRLDLVCLWFWTPRPAARLAVFMLLLRLLKVPVVREVDESTWSQRDETTALERLWSPLSGMAGVLAISAELDRWARAEARGRPLRVVEVPILVDVDEHAPSAYPDGDPVVVFAGAPGYNETIRFIFAAMDEVWRSRPDCRLAVTGADPHDPASDWLRAEVRDAGLGGRVDLVGYLDRDELLALYARAHALLIPLFDNTRSKARFPTKIGEYLGGGAAGGDERRRRDPALLHRRRRRGRVPARRPGRLWPRHRRPAGRPRSRRAHRPPRAAGRRDAVPLRTVRRDAGARLRRDRRRGCVMRGRGTACAA